MRLRRGLPRHIYYWVGYVYNGNQHGLLGPFKTENEANQTAFTKLSGLVFQVVPLDTRDKSAASGKMKAIILNDTNDITQAMHRIRRKEPDDFHGTENMDNPPPIIY
jgi:hypothetical protein